MKTVAISTIIKHYLLSNYGSFFQHYSLRLVLKRMGFTPFRVVPKDEDSSLSAMCINQVKDWIRPFYWFFTRLPNREIIVRQMKVRDRTNWLFLSDWRRLIGKFDEVQCFDSETIGVRGGDQVLDIGTDYEWLECVKVGNARITYAASTDWCSRGASSDWREFIEKKLKRFTAVGLREPAGVEIVKGLVADDIPVEHVADPVQLLKLEDFKAIQSAKPIFNKHTLFCYLVNIRSDDDLRLNEYERLAKMLGCDLKFVGIQGGELFIPKKYRVLYSPRQFLRAIDDCKYFITNSYHGSVLAMQYQKNFISVWQNCLPGTNQNERQKELMHKFGIQDHWVDYKLPTEEWHRIITTSIDWHRVNAEAEEWRTASLEWLKKAIGEVKVRDVRDV